MWLIQLHVMSMIGGLTVGALTECQSHFGQTVLLSVWSLAPGASNTSIIHAERGKSRDIHGARETYLLITYCYLIKTCLSGNLDRNRKENVDRIMILSSYHQVSSIRKDLRGTLWHVGSEFPHLWYRDKHHCTFCCIINQLLLTCCVLSNLAASAIPGNHHQ